MDFLKVFEGADPQLGIARKGVQSKKKGKLKLLRQGLRTLFFSIISGGNSVGKFTDIVALKVNDSYSHVLSR